MAKAVKSTKGLQVPTSGAKGTRSSGPHPRGTVEGEDGPAETLLDVPSQPFLRAQLEPHLQAVRKAPAKPATSSIETAHALSSLRTKTSDPKPTPPFAREKLPQELQRSLEGLRGPRRNTHGAKFSLAYFPQANLRTPCADRFGYLAPAAVRQETKLPFTPQTRKRLEALGELMANQDRESSVESDVPAGYTYVGQFIDHDITLDVSSSLEIETPATKIHNLRTPILDLDSVYGQGPALQPYLYAPPSSGNPTAIKLRLGKNLLDGPGGPTGHSGLPQQMVQLTDFDVPRTADDTHTALLGDPRNDENLIVVQFHHAMLRFHNAVVDHLVERGFTGDVFVEAKRQVTLHFQWAVLHDFLERHICAPGSVSAALRDVTAAVGSPFRMPVEFSVAAYRMGHSMIRNQYWLNFNFPKARLGEVFTFNRSPNLPVRSKCVVDFNAFFNTGNPVPVDNMARRLDSVLAKGLEELPGMSGMMAVLATRNLLRGLALGLPSGQGLAKHWGIPVLSEAELTSGLSPDEIAILRSGGRLLLTKTPLWYYVLREAAVRQRGTRLGPLGSRIVASTFVRILKRDPDSILNVSGGFTPVLPSKTAGDFTFPDLLRFARVLA